MNVRFDDLPPLAITARNGDAPQLATAAESVVELRSRHGTTCDAIQQSLGALGHGRFLERIRLAMADATPTTDARSAAALAGILACVDLWIRR